MGSLRVDPDHDAVVASRARHLVITAPPGTGKTCLSARLAGQSVSTLPPGARVLLMTFSTQARTQLERETARQLGPAVRRRVEVTNYHRFFWQVVRAYRRALGLPMRLDIGSRQRRAAALAAVEPAADTALQTRDGLIESLAEHQFEQFRDARTPDGTTLARLLAVVQREQQAGRLVFDDLGALVWQLLEQFPVLLDTYRARYPVVIADEHQDASALQDALVCRLAPDRLVVFADPMQLIHEFRGASQERLDRHIQVCDEHLALRAPHRWHAHQELGNWLLAVRTGLEGGPRPVRLPRQVRISYSPAEYGFNGMKPRIKLAVAQAFQQDVQTVAVLARANDQVAELRTYLSRQGQYPLQIGTEDFEDARLDIEQLPHLKDAREIAVHGLDRLQALVPTLPPAVASQVRQRLQPTGPNLRRAGLEAAAILQALAPIYRDSAGGYFTALVAAMDACVQAGHHLPRAEAVQALRGTVEALTRADGPVLDRVLECYAEQVVAGTYSSSRTDHGLFVMTAHQAKGKEFDVVVLADVSARFWPDTAEARRLFYVALTRATSRCVLIAPSSGASTLLSYLTDEPSGMAVPTASHQTAGA